MRFDAPCRPTVRPAAGGVLGQRLPTSTKAALGLLLLLTVAASAGCGGDGLQRQVLYGRVTYDGQKVTGGDILFVPRGDTTGPTTGAKIEDGQYRADHRGGVPVGSHQVRVRGFLGELPPTPQGGPDNIVYPTVPDEFYTASTIEVTLESGVAKAEMHFDLLPGMKLHRPESP